MGEGPVGPLGLGRGREWAKWAGGGEAHAGRERGSWATGRWWPGLGPRGEGGKGEVGFGPVRKGGSFFFPFSEFDLGLEFGWILWKEN